MEPKLVRKDIKYQKKTLMIVSLLVISLFIGGSFALLSSSDETEEVVTFKTGNFNLEVATTGTLSLDGEVPKSYDDGFKNNDITLTLTNTGSLEIGKYDVKLEGDTGTTLDANYIRYSVSDDEGKTYLASKLLSETNNIIYTGYSLKDTKVLKVKLWIDEDAGEAALKKSYNGKINVELYQNDDTLVDVVKSKLVSNYSGSNESFEGGVVAVNNDGNLYHETKSETIREYRYSGLTVNNYVTFNDEVWRIVGVFKDENGEEHIKIVRNEVIKPADFPTIFEVNNVVYNIKSTETNGDYAYWNSKASDSNNDWATAGIQYWLNAGDDEQSKSPEAGYMSYLSKDAKDMIEKTKYYLGTLTYYNQNMNGGSTAIYGIKDTANEAYKNERAVTGCDDKKGPTENNSTLKVQDNATCRVWANNQATWEGKIALLYPSDYGYSADSSHWNIILGRGTFDGNASDRNWLQQTLNHNDIYEWLLSPSIYGYGYTSVWNPTGYLNCNYVSLSAWAIRPTLYLKNDVKITGGTGTQENPYKLILN